MDAPSRTRHEPAAKAESAEEFLRREIEGAQAALSQSLRDAKGTLAHAADARTWVRQFPWLSLGASAGLGFAISSLVTPSRGEELREKLAQLKEELQGRKEKWKERRKEKRKDRRAAAAAAIPEEPQGRSLWVLALSSVVQLLLRAFSVAEPQTEHVVKIVGVNQASAES